MKTKRHALTLMEIMIVVCLIGIIISAIGFNMKGSLEKGKKFKTEQFAGQIKDILQMEMSDSNQSPSQIVARWTSIIENSPLPKKPKELLYDAWGNPFTVTYDAERQDFIVTSLKYE